MIPLLKASSYRCKGAPVYDPTALTRATKPFSIKRVSRNSRAALCQRSLPFSVCRCPLRKYHGQAGSNPICVISGGGFNGSMQHFLEVYSRESENLKFVVGVDLSAALLCSDPTGNSRLGLCSSGSIVVRARLCFRSSRVARDSADHRSTLSHPWPP